jgi:hypothetical protein
MNNSASKMYTVVSQRVVPDLHATSALSHLQDPNDVINRYGADALRLYLINSPVVRADNLAFQVCWLVGWGDTSLPWPTPLPCPPGP